MWDSPPTSSMASDRPAHDHGGYPSGAAHPDGHLAQQVLDGVELGPPVLARSASNCARRSRRSASSPSAILANVSATRPSACTSSMSRSALPRARPVRGTGAPSDSSYECVQSVPESSTTPSGSPESRPRRAEPGHQRPASREHGLLSRLTLASTCIPRKVPPRAGTDCGSRATVHEECRRRRRVTPLLR